MHAIANLTYGFISILSNPMRGEGNLIVIKIKIYQ